MPSTPPKISRQLVLVVLLVVTLSLLSAGVQLVSPPNRTLPPTITPTLPPTPRLVITARPAGARLTATPEPGRGELPPTATDAPLAPDQTAQPVVRLATPALASVLTVVKPRASGTPANTATPAVELATAKLSASVLGLGYEQWGQPVQGSCASFNDLVPVRRLNVRLQIANQGPAALPEGQWTASATSRGGANGQALVCTQQALRLPELPAGQSREVGFLVFVDLDQSVSKIAISASGAALNLCLNDTTSVSCAQP